MMTAAKPARVAIFWDFASFWDGWRRAGLCSQVQSGSCQRRVRGCSEKRHSIDRQPCAAAETQTVQMFQRGAPRARRELLLGTHGANKVKISADMRREILVALARLQYISFRKSPLFSRSIEERAADGQKANREKCKD